MTTQADKVTRRRLTGFVLSTVVALSTFLPYLPVEAAGVTTGTSGTMDATGSTSGAGGGLYDIETPPFRVGIMRDTAFYNDGTPEMGKRIIKEWSHRYPNNSNSIYLLPAGGRTFGGSLEVGKYDASSRKLLLYNNDSQLSRVRRLNKLTNTPTNPAKAYLKAYSFSGSKRFSTLAKGAWKTTIASKFSNDNAEDMWAYVFTPSSTGKYSISSRMEQAISSYADDFNSNSATTVEKDDVSRGYLGMLIGTWKLIPSDQRGPWESAIEDYLTSKNQNIGSKVASLVVDTAVTMQLVKQNKYLIFPTYDYFQYYTALGSNNSLYTMTASKLGTAVGDTYDTLIKVVQRDIKDAPKANRISNVFNADNAFSWGASAIVYPDYRFGSANNVPKWTSVNIKAAVMDTLKLGDTSNGAVRGFITTGSMATSAYNPTVFKNPTTFTALDDNKMLPTGATTVGVKTRLIFQKKADSSVTNSWDNLFKNSPDENKEITVKITPNRLTSPSQTSGASYTSVLGNFTTGVKLTRSQFVKFIGGSLKIQMDDNTVNEKVAAGTTKTFTYSPRVEIKYTLGGKAQTWTEDLKDTASYKAAPINAPADPTLKAILYSTPDKKEVLESSNVLGEKTKLTLKHALDTNNTYITSWDKIFNYNKTANATVNISAVPSRVSTPSTTIAPSYTSTLGNSFATSTGVNIPKEDFREFIKGERSLVIEDNTTNIGIEENKTNTYSYGVDLKISFTVDGKKHTVLQTVKNPASFFKKEYVTGSDLVVTPTTPPAEKTCEELGNCPTDPKVDDPSVPPDTSTPVTPPPSVPYMGFTSDPRAFSELKEGTPNNESFEAMAGVPSNKRLYLGVGGDEFVVDVELEYKKDVESVWRTYRSYFTGTPSEFKDGDTAKGKTLGGQSVDTHEGGTYTKTWTGSIPNKGTAKSGTGTATSVAVPDRTAYNRDKTAAQAYADSVNATTLTHTAASDKVTRSSKAWNAAITTDSPQDPKDNTQTKYKTGTTIGEPVTAYPSPDGSYTIIVTFKVPAHIIDGPECDYDLPTVEDNWKQKIKYDYLKIVRADVYKITEGRLTKVEDLFGSDKESLSATIKSGDPKIFANIAQKNAGGDDVKAQSSKYGRLRYTLEEGQNDTVVWNEGVRSNKSAGMGKNGSSYAPQGGGHNNSWAKGILYNNKVASTEKDYHRDRGVKTTTVSTSADTIDTTTPEWKKFDERRKALNKATVISDMLILETSSGDQSVIYFDKDSETIQSQEQFKEMDVTRETMWDNNVNSAAKWQTSRINVGSYNGMYKSVGTTASTNKKYWGYRRDTNVFIDNTTGGSRSQILTRFDSNGVGVDGLTPRPARPAKMYMYGDEAIVPTTSNGGYNVGETSVFYKNVLFWESPNAYVGDVTGKDVRSFTYASAEQEDFGGQLGLVVDAPYSKDHEKVNDVIVYTPITSENAMVVGLDKSLDQRTELPSGGSSSLIDEQSAAQNDAQNSKDPNATFDPAIDTESTAKTTISTVRTTKTSTKSSPDAKGVKTFTQIGTPETFVAPETGNYTLETWGAKGGNRDDGFVFNGGLGGYAKGTVKLTKGDSLTIVVGGKGMDSTDSTSYDYPYLTGGYNGGGNSGTDSDGSSNHVNEMGSSGGGYSIIKKGNTSLLAGGGGGGVNYASFDGATSVGGAGTAGGGGGGSYNNSGIPGSGSKDVNNNKIGGDAYYPEGQNGTGYTNSTVTDSIIQTGVNSGNDGNGKVVITYDITVASTDTEKTEELPVKNSTDVSNSSVGDKDGYEGWSWEQLFGLNWQNYITSKTTSSSDSTTETSTSTSETTEGYKEPVIIPAEPFEVKGGMAIPYDGYGGGYSITLSNSILEGDTIIIETLNGVSENNTVYAPVVPSDFFKFGVSTDGRQIYKKTATKSDIGRTINVSGAGAYGLVIYAIPAGYSVEAVNSDSASYNYDSKGKSVFVVSTGNKPTSYNGYSKAVVSNEDEMATVLYKEVVSVDGSIILPTFTSVHNSNVPHLIFTETGVIPPSDGSNTGSSTTTSITDVVTTKVDTTEVKTVTAIDEEKVKTDLATFPDRMPDGTWNPVKLKFGAGQPLPPSPTKTSITTSSGAVLNLATFLTLDRAFKVYYPNSGDFAQRTDLFGTDVLATTRGKGYVNNMDVTQYMDKKRVKFSFNVVFNNDLYTAGSWIPLPLTGEYYDFYAVNANKEQSGALVEFDTVAINGNPVGDPENDNASADSNKERLPDYSALHGGYKKSYIDLIGRIGNFVVSDTEDFRFSNLFKKVKPDGKDLLDGLVKEVDSSQQNKYYGDLYDLRGVAVNSTGHRLNTYGTQTWLEQQPLALPINPKDNTNKALKEQFMKPGYDILADITTTGNYADGALRVLPYYYKLNVDTGEVTPLDAYVKEGNGYKVVNKYKGADDGTLPSGLYKYDLSLDWENEAPRRNFSLDEATITRTVSEVYGEYITGFIEMPGSDERVEGVIGVDPLVTPKGNFVSLGNAQRIVASKGARTFIGTTETYGVNKQLNDSVPTSEWNYATQRWHLKIGLPSSAVFVEAGKAVTQENIEDVKKGNGVMLLTADIVSLGNLFAIRYEQKGLTSFSVTKDGKSRVFDISASGLPPVIALYDLQTTSVTDIEVKGSH